MIGTGQSGRGPEREHALDLADHRVGERVIGLVDDDDVRDLHHPGLERLDRVAGAGHEHEHDGVGMVDDVDLGLADADGLQQHQVAPRRVHEQRGLQRRLAQSAESAAVGHRADEHAGIEEMVGEPDPIAQQRALGERRRGVDGEDGDRAVTLPLELGEGPHQRRLAHAGRPGEANDGGAAGLRVDRADQLPALGVVVLDQRDGARQRAAIPLEQAFSEILVGLGHRRPAMMSGVVGDESGEGPEGWGTRC